MARFFRFKDGGLAKIATSLGYTGDMSGFQDYLEKNPILKDKMKKYEDSAVQMASEAKSSDYQQTQEQAKNTVGQFVPPPKQTFETTKMATGGVLPQAYVPTLGTGTGQVDAYKKGQKLTDVTASQAQTGAMPVGAVTQARSLINAVPGMDVVEMEQAEVCCGFGGTFAVKYPEISGAMLQDKIDNIRDSEADTVVACDSTCLMHIAGGLEKQNVPVECVHLAQ